MSSYAAKLQVKMSTKGADKTINDIDGVSRSADQATRSSDNLAGSGGKLSRAFSSIEAPAKTVAKGVAVVATAALAAGAAITAIVKASSEAARELTFLSYSANTSAENFQALAFAAKSVGFEVKDLSDVYKDMSDRVGDFIATGAGPAADFFEKIAPLVGVTAQQFKKLSAPDALQLYVSSLEKAGLSQSEMVFYMEALSSESTRLLPLLMDNGKQMNVMADRARDLGIVLSDIEVAELANAGKTFDEVGSIIGNVTDQIAIQFAPLIGDIAKRFTDAAIDAGGFGPAVKSTMMTAAESIGVFMDVMSFMGRMWDGVKVAVIGVEMVFVKSMQGWSMISDLTFSGIASMIKWLADKFDIFARYINGIAPSIFSGIGRGADTAFNYVAEKINWLITKFNAIPGVDDIELFNIDASKFEDLFSNISPTIVPTIDMGSVEYGASALTKNLGIIYDGAKNQLNGLVTAMTDAANNPPSEGLMTWFAGVQDASAAAAAATVTAQGEANVRSIENAKDTGQELVAVSNLVSLQNSKAWNASRKDRDAKEKAADAKAAAAAIANAEMVANQKQAVMSNMSSVFQSMMQSGSKKEFEIGKKASTAMAIMNTYQGATKALAQGGLWGIAQAASIVAMGFMNVRKIQSQSFGGSSGGGAAAAAPSLPSIQEPVAASRQSSVNISIGDSQFFSRDTVMQLIEGLNDAVADGAQLRVV